jgi:predicted glycoside hydrolase/deacetylase ChbG (UPF0249 family)
MHEEAADAPRLIVNADDLGISPEVNDAIFELMSLGRITSSTILANGPALTAALAHLRLFPKCSFGVHLNITQFPPLTAAPAFAGLLDHQGALRKVIREVPVPPDLRQAIYEEWSAQITRLLHAGVSLSHVDSHNHSHTLPVLLPVMRRLRGQFGIPRARVSINLFRPDEPKPPLLGLKKRIFNAALRHYCGFRTPDACADFESFLLAFPRRLPALSSIELMTHPGHPRYGNELRLLHEDWQRRWPCRLVSYREL